MFFCFCFRDSEVLLGEWMMSGRMVCLSEYLCTSYEANFEKSSVLFVVVLVIFSTHVSTSLYICSFFVLSQWRSFLLYFFDSTLLFCNRCCGYCANKVRYLFSFSQLFPQQPNSLNVYFYHNFFSANDRFN